MGGLCSSPVEQMLADLQHHCDEQTEIIETMIEVEAEDKQHVRSLQKDVEVMDILLDQYEQAFKSLKSLLDENTMAMLQKLSEKRKSAASDRRMRALELGVEHREHQALVRPSDDDIMKAQSKAAAKRVTTAHAETSANQMKRVESRRQKARERVQHRLKTRSGSVRNVGNKPALSLTPLPDSVRRHPSLTGSASPKSFVKSSATAVTPLPSVNTHHEV